MLSGHKSFGHNFVAIVERFDSFATNVFVYMDAIKELREATGLSQYQLAALLNITRSQLSMAELGSRDLPIPVRATLYELVDSLNQPLPVSDKPAQKEQQKQKAALAAHLKKEAAKCERRVKTLTRQLQAIEARHQQATDLLDKLNRLQVALADSPHDDRQQLVLNIATATALKKLNQPTPRQLATMQLNVKALQARAAHAAELADNVFP